MDCKSIQKKIPDFSEGKLSAKDDLEFINHVAECKDCHEELEIYYMLQYGISDEEPETYDFVKLVDLRLDNRFDEIMKMRRNKKIMFSLWGVVNLLLLLEAGIYLIEKIVL